MTRRRVAAVITDGLESVAVARRAAALAGPGGHVLGLIPMPRPPWTMDAAIARRIESRLVVDAAAIAARARPVLDRAGVVLTVKVVRHSGRRGAALRAIRKAARRAKLEVVILPDVTEADRHAGPWGSAHLATNRSIDHTGAAT